MFRNPGVSAVLFSLMAIPLGELPEKDYHKRWGQVHPRAHQSTCLDTHGEELYRFYYALLYTSI